MQALGAAIVANHSFATVAGDECGNNFDGLPGPVRRPSKAVAQFRSLAILSPKFLFGAISHVQHHRH
jgi:hypothetical protein